MEEKLLCVYTPRDVADFAVISMCYLIPFGAGMIIGKFWTALALWFGIASIVYHTFSSKR
jgi:hypothetical protein